jgi:hypothetical protein
MVIVSGRYQLNIIDPLALRRGIGETEMKKIAENKDVGPVLRVHVYENTRPITSIIYNTCFNIPPSNINI